MEFVVGAEGHQDVVIGFFVERQEYERNLESMREAIAPAIGIWIAWPKKASKVPTDITEDIVRDVALPTGPGGQQGLRHRRRLVRAAVGHPARAALSVETLRVSGPWVRTRGRPNGTTRRR